MSLIAELKRRNVFKVSAAYLALAWVVIQITASVVPALNLPASINAIVVWAGFAGFPFVVLFAWIYELTPEGLKRESEVDRSQSITHVTSRKLDFIIIGLLVAAMAMFLVDRFAPRETDIAVGAGNSNGPRDSSIAQEEDRGHGPLPQQQTAPAQAEAPDGKSIAVLPFVNMSEDANNAYFADGISEELLNLLAKIPELRVTSRTSAFSFKGQNLELSEIASRLKVAHILEGSVRKAGNKVRITAQLLDTRTDTHLWSETYDRSLDDIFAVQNEIASAVVEQLKITLLGAPPKARETNPEAYAMYLQARQLRRQATAASLEQALALGQKALALDPAYATAWEEMGSAYLNQATNNIRPIDEAYALAREATSKALELDPDNARAHDSLGWIAATYDLDFAAAATHYTRAMVLAPNNLAILGNAGTMLLAMGRFQDSTRIQAYTTGRDPVNTIGIANFATGLVATGRLDEAVAHFQLLLSLAPDYLSGHGAFAQALLVKGEADAALEQALLEGDEAMRLATVAMVQHTRGDRAESDAALAELRNRFADRNPYLVAAALAWRGDAGGAFESLDKARAAHDAGLFTLLGDRTLDGLHEDPRWLAFLQRNRMAPEQLAAISFDVKLPPP